MQVGHSYWGRGRRRGRGQVAIVGETKGAEGRGVVRSNHGGEEIWLGRQAPETSVATFWDRKNDDEEEKHGLCACLENLFNDPKWVSSI
jgi:hypothetical protein